MFEGEARDRNETRASITVDDNIFARHLPLLERLFVGFDEEPKNRTQREMMGPTE